MNLGGIRLTAVVLLLAMAGGCGAVVYPPTKFTDPEAFYLAKYNVHSCVLLPSNGRFVDYSFGDWNYAALHHKLINDAIVALTISGDSAFERRIVQADPKTGEPILDDNPKVLLRLYADRSAIAKRLTELEDRFQMDMKENGEDPPVIQIGADYSIIFVKDSEHYSLTNNCNYLTAETLRALGYRVEGMTITNHFSLQAPAQTVDGGAAEGSMHLP
jgi:hypothetical protein